jgi:hypothetical protein
MSYKIYDFSNNKNGKKYKTKNKKMIELFDNLDNNSTNSTNSTNNTDDSSSLVVNTFYKYSDNSTDSSYQSDKDDFNNIVVPKKKYNIIESKLDQVNLNLNQLSVTLQNMSTVTSTSNNQLGVVLQHMSNEPNLSNNQVTGSSSDTNCTLSFDLFNIKLSGTYINNTILVIQTVSNLQILDTNGSCIINPNIIFNSLVGDISIVNSDINHIYQGVIYTDKNNIVINLSNRPIVPISVNINAVITIRLNLY